MEKMTNKKFSETDQVFRKACNSITDLHKLFTIKKGSKTISVNHDSLGLKRQASKYLLGKGLAFKEGKIYVK